MLFIDWSKLEENKDRGARLLKEMRLVDIKGRKYKLEQLTSGSNRKMLWECEECHHQWYAMLYNRTALGTNCPYCTGQRVSSSKSLYTWCLNNEQGKQIQSEWTGISEDGKHYKMDEVSYSSHTKMLWRCANGHEWYATINHRTSKNFKRKCPYCSGYKVSVLNSLSTWCLRNTEIGRIITSQWTGISEDGKYYTMDEVSYGSKLKMLWRCADGHEWYATVHDRTHGRNCPECYNKNRSEFVRKTKTNSENSLSTWCLNNEQGKQIQSEWTGISESGKRYTMDEVSYGSNLKMLWCDEFEHKWYATIHHRTQGRGCPYCNASSQTSYPEQFIYWALKQLYPETQNRCKVLQSPKYPQGIEYDIIVPDIPLAIEYSPTYWHKGKEEKDNIKKEICNKCNIRFIQIIVDSYTEYEEEYTENYICIPELTPSNRDDYLQKIVSCILKSIGHSIEELDIDLVKKNALEYSKKKIEYEKSVEFIYTTLAAEFHPTLNTVKPSEITPGSKLRIKFICPNCNYGSNGEWENSANSRIYFKSGCPSCGFNWSAYELLEDLNKRLTEYINNYSDEMQSWDF